MLVSLAERQNQQQISPAYNATQEKKVSLKSGFGKTGEALFEPTSSESVTACGYKTHIIEATVIRYNLINKFLRSLDGKADFAAFLI